MFLLPKNKWDIRMLKPHSEYIRISIQFIKKEVWINSTHFFLNSPKAKYISKVENKKVKIPCSAYFYRTGDLFVTLICCYKSSRQILTHLLTHLFSVFYADLCLFTGFLQNKSKKEKRPRPLIYKDFGRFFYGRGRRT